MAAKLRWHYGPTEADPDPGSMWCYDCGGRVDGFEGVYICSCGRVDDPEEEFDQDAMREMYIMIHPQGESIEDDLRRKEEWTRSEQYQQLLREGASKLCLLLR